MRALGSVSLVIAAWAGAAAAQDQRSETPRSQPSAPARPLVYGGDRSFRPFEWLDERGRPQG